MLRKLPVVLGVIFILLMAGSSYALKDNMMAAWTFEDEGDDFIHDVSGNGNDGAFIGGVEWTDGKFGEALRFNGTASHIELPFADSINVLNKSDFTFATWFVTDEVPASNRVVLQQLDLNGTGRTWLYIVGGTAEVATHVGGTRTSSGVNAIPGEWHHAAVVVTEGGGTDTVQVYVDGEPAGAPGKLGMEDSEGTFHIGAHKNAANNVWFGVLDEMVIFDKALSKAEINSLMTRGIVGVQAVDPTSKLAATWGNIKSGIGQ
ncbi:LamG domain-containing protein [Candidatus Poribacteria bacterium]